MRHAAIAAVVLGLLAAPRPAAADVVRDNGFVVRTDDGAYQVRIGGYVQLRHGSTWRGGERAGGFALRRTRLILEGTLGPELSYRVMTELVGQPLLFDAYADWKLGRGWALRAGRDKTPLTRSFLLSASRLSFAERPVAVDAHRPGRDLGAQLRWGGAAARAVVGIGNGAPDGVAPDELPSGWGRVELAALGALADGGAGDVRGTAAPSLTLGASALVDSVPAPAAITGIAPVVVDPGGDGRPDRVLVVAASADATFRLRGLELTGELLVRREDWGELLAANRADPDARELGDVIARDRPVYLAAYGEATHMIVPGRLLAGARVGWGDLPVLSLRGASAVPRGDRALELAGVLQLYRGGMRVVGLTYALVDWGAAPGGGPDGGLEHRAVLEAQLQL